MNLFLTSSGITNQTIARELLRFVEKSADEITIGFIPTAAYVEEDTSWLDEDIENIRKVGVRNIQMVDIAKMKKEEWLRALEDSDVVWLNGGNTYYLLDQVRKSGLQAELPRLLESRLYVGSSAGSIIAGPDLAINELFPEEAEYKLKDITGLNFVPFTILPHYKSPLFPEPTIEEVEQFASTYPDPIYAIDDDTAIVVVDGDINMVSEGEYKIFDK